MKAILVGFVKSEVLSCSSISCFQFFREPRKGDYVKEVY
jgi:hypothetical protein